MAHIHLRGVMAQNIRFDLLDQRNALAVGNVDLVQRRLGVEIRFLAGREVIEDMHLVTVLDISIDNVRGDKAGAAGNDDSS